MWNSLCTIWRWLNNLIWILSTLFVVYVLYMIFYERSRFVFLRPNPVVNGNAAEQQEPVKPRDENPVDE